MRRAGKMGLSELLMWDVVLAAVVGGLAYYDSQAANEPVPADTAPGDAGEPDPRKTEIPESPPEKTIDPAVRVRREQEAQLARLREEARGHLPGSPQAALAVYDSAPLELRLSAEWKEFYPAERKRLLRRQSALDTGRCMRAAVQLAADAGRPDLVQALLAHVPAGQRAGLEGEVEWARRAKRERKEAPPPKRDDGKKNGGGLQIKGFRPGQTSRTLQGKHCVVDCRVGQLGERLRSEIDSVITQAGWLLRTAPGGTLKLRLLGPKDPYDRGGGFRVTRRRPAEQEGRVVERVRLLTARWVVRAIYESPRLTPWRRALCRLLATVERKGRFTESGACRRRLFLVEPPDGKGSALLALAANPADTTADPTGARAWALMHFACFSSEAPASRLKGILLRELRGESQLRTWLTPPRALGLEAAWVAHMKQAE